MPSTNHMSQSTDQWCSSAINYRIITGYVLQYLVAANQWLTGRVDRWTRSLGISFLITILYWGSIFLYSVSPASNVSISGSYWHTLAFSAVAGIVTIGVPVFLWHRYELRSPGTLLVCILVFWHVLVYVPPIGTGQGDSPGFLFVFLLAPLYLLAYVGLAATEYWARSRGGYWSPSTE